MARKQAIVKQIQGVTFAGKSDSNHWIVMDGPAEFGGSNAGSRPKELLLVALGGCTGSDVASILAKRRVSLRGFELHLSGNVREQHPQIFTDIHIEYIFYGEDIDPKEVERAIELSTTTYCAISAMLQSVVTLTHSYKIEPSVNLSKPKERGAR